MARKRNTYKGGDHFNRLARDQGYEARSVFKLKELDERFRLLAPGQRVLDLGCCPGSWSRWAVERVGARGLVVGVDLEETSVPGMVFHRADVRELPVAEISASLGGRAQVVLSDMAPRTTGNRLGDHVDQIALVDAAFACAQALLEPGGAFVAKVFDGEDAPALVERLRPAFARLKRVRPEAVRRESRELFLVCQDFRPRPLAPT